MRSAADAFAAYGENTATSTLSFTDFGSNAAKALGVSPDAFVQAAYQLAHQRAKGHLGATYESIATRQYRHGRTEAMRVVTTEMVAFVSAMEDPAADADARRAAFRAATAARADGLVVTTNSYIERRVALTNKTPYGAYRGYGQPESNFVRELLLDRLARRLAIDPVELRLKNYTERDLGEDKPFSSKELRACYRRAAEKFGWAGHDPRPRSMRHGNTLIGWGMAGGIWEAMQQ